LRTAHYGPVGPPKWSASQRAIDAVCEERERGGGLVIIEGRRGAGRTSILHSIYRNFRDAARYVAVERWVRGLPLALVERLIEVTAPKVHSELFPDLTTRLESPNDELGAVFIEACQHVLAEWRAAGNLVILVDDIHLSDTHSQQLISYLGRRLDNTGIIMVVSVPSPTPTVDQDLDELLHNPVSSRVAVTPLEHSAIQHLAQSMGIYGLDSTAVTALIDYTGGWLEYVVQILRALPDGRWPTDPAALPLPERIVADVMQPIQQCDHPDVWKLVCALAVLEDPPGLQILNKIADIEDVSSAIDTAVAARILQGGVLREAYNTDQLQLRFTHPMAGQVIVRQMLPSEHRQYHLRAAKHLEHHGQRLLHRAAAAVTRDPVLGGEMIRFAERLGRTGRWEQAARFRFAAARLMDSTTQRRTEVLSGVDALASAGRITAAVPWLPTIDAMPPSSTRESVLAHVALHQGRAADAAYLLNQADQDATQNDDRARVALRHCLDKLCSWDPAGITAWADRAVELSQPGEAAHVEALAIRGVGLAAQGLTDIADESILRAGMDGHDGPHNQRYRLCAGWVALLEGNLHTAYRQFEAALPTQKRGGSLRISLWAQAWLSRIQFIQGDWDGALQGALSGIRRAEHAGMDVMLPLLEWTAREIQLWRNEQPQDSWWQATNTTTLRGYAVMHIPARMTQAVERKVNNDQEGALAALMPLMELDPWTDRQTSLWHWQPELIHAMTVANLIDEAAELTEDYAAVTAKAPRFVQATALASRARVAAAKKDTDAAEQLFQQALRLTSLDGVATYHGRYLFAYGQMLRRTGRRRDAASRLVSARDFFESVNATVMVERCDQELRATGMVQHRRDEPEIDTTEWSGLDQPAVQLTPQEHAVAELVVQGLTNRETARQLFIAEKTVQYHLTRIYAKFGIRSRTELARVYPQAEDPAESSNGSNDLSGDES
jgi:DNA-binding CsgD family transcriptional regulator